MSRHEYLPGWAAYKRLLRYVLPFWHVFLLSVLGFALFSLAEIMLVDMVQLVLDAMGDNTKQGSGIVSSIARWMGVDVSDISKVAGWIVVVIAVFGVIRGLGYFLGNYYINYVATGMVHTMRCDVFNKLLRSPSVEFDAHPSGFLISRITYTVDQVSNAGTNALKILLREGVMTIGLLVYLFIKSWQLTTLFLLVTPIIGLLVYWVGRRFRKISRRIQHSMGDITSVAGETINGYREVRMYGGSEDEHDRFTHSSDKNRAQAMKMAFYKALSPPAIQFPVIMVVAAMMWIALSYFSFLTPGEFIVYIGLALLLPKSIRQLTEVNAIIQRGIAAAQDIFRFIDSPDEPNPGTHKVERVDGHIEVRRLNFRYGADSELVLSNINFTVDPGQTLALVGVSGSGKSTLVSLLARFYWHEQGEILIDGVDVNEYELQCLRRQIALVSQRVMLFNDTVYNNIAYGELRGAPRDAVLAAAEAAQALDFIERLPQGMDTLIGEDGVMLSGGQRQRIAIARAILKDAPILILDEATSALDNRAEMHIQQALESVMRGRTTIVIAHRLSTIENADKILVMEEGRVIEEGNHSELLARGGRYAELYNRDFSEQ